MKKTYLTPTAEKVNLQTPTLLVGSKVTTTSTNAEIGYGGSSANYSGVVRSDIFNCSVWYDTDYEE